MSLAETIATALGGAKKTPGGYLCKCPCHDDSEQKPSLSIKETEKGLIFNCFANCAWEDIKAYLESRGLIPKRKADRYEGARFYIYRDIVGNVLCRKVKLPSKKMWFERLEGTGSGAKWIAGLNEMSVPLYNLKSVLESDPIYLCEGEKDAETIISTGLCGTTNHAGAKSWKAELSDQLKGKTVVIVPDNDDAGRARVKKVSAALQGIAKEVRVFIPNDVPEHGDITDWVQAGNDPAQIFQKSVLTQATKSKKAKREDYFELFETVLDHPKKCIFNEKLMHFDAASGVWNPAINALELIKSEALVCNENADKGGIKFSVSSILPHFFAFEASKPLEFLVEIPEWDEKDRLSEMAYMAHLKVDDNLPPVSQDSFSELLKEWCATMFQRLYDPMIQNRILVLQGDQGIGKDTWTSMLVDGLGQFCVPLAILKEDKDTYLNLHRGLVMKVSEYDKTSKTEVSTLKDIITAPSTNLRAPYDRDARLRLSRCSFIASANAKDLLRDTTGNRRYMIFNLSKIDYPHSKWSREEIKTWQMQCLAEMAHLGKLEYKASSAAWAEMNAYIVALTPMDMGEDITELFWNQFKRDVSFGLSTDIEFSDNRLSDIFTHLSRQTGLRFGTVKTMVRQRAGVYRRVGQRRIWVLRIEDRAVEVMPAQQELLAG